jgi:hypothetical protein
MHILIISTGLFVLTGITAGEGQLIFITLALSDLCGIADRSVPEVRDSCFNRAGGGCKTGSLITMAKIIILLIFAAPGLSLILQRGNGSAAFAPFMPNGWARKWGQA